MNIKDYLDEQAARINTPAFIDTDPVQFPRRYARLQDIEIAAFLTATIAWGKRTIILNSAERMLSKLGSSPYDFVMGKGYTALGKANVHRTFFEPDLVYFLRGLRHIYENWESVNSFFIDMEIGKIPNPVWQATHLLRTEFIIGNGQMLNSKCIPANFENSALKRINLAFRWLVRNDGIVDLGVWDCIKPSQLNIPLDVHVGNTARELGILTRKSNDRKAVEELTGILRSYNFEDPTLYDFALLGIGINSKKH
jgi:uncharacterized protein (TIGR02757 family)